MNRTILSTVKLPCINSLNRKMNGCIQALANANGKLDTWFYGKPKEPYGFSNNARNAFGIPRFEESRFVVDTENTQLTITVK